MNVFLGYVFVTSHHCDKMPEYINLNEEKFNLAGSQFTDSSKSHLTSF